MMTQKKIIKLVKNFCVAFAIILIWRGVWYVLDAIDIAVFGGNHAFTAIGGVIVGLIMLYLPDHDLKELGKL